MIDHTNVCIPQDRFEECHKFYLGALSGLGYEQKMQFGPYAVGLGEVESSVPGYVPTDFWLMGCEQKDLPKFHTAFRAKDRATVDAFYEAAIKAGGKDNGPPGVRSHYHANYYAAFITDPLGNNIEAVCHSPA
ncbi:Glyoxalase/Bleomycin resistance protein/Dihydroxybiphenyl dioxygenase [Stachybotrys elegans]|uniref:Glyoxalase/Bleomycin resistance protein/Dihydroxybiphenyl dioxygenase n=1 Tax=Stachybotrys elegans TaxID=80388 RepID=A0A8K0WP75_9HYPO|nr:Glyoxalase/Bleomycin resistance protein/Dihydroxybiphenyl dioxygenase [Stachybotrys elegans]